MSCSYKEISERKVCGSKICVCLHIYSPLFFINPTVWYGKEGKSYVLLLRLATFSWIQSVWQNSSKAESSYFFAATLFSRITQALRVYSLQEYCFLSASSVLVEDKACETLMGKNNQIDSAENITVTQGFLSSVAPTLCIQPKGKERLSEEVKHGTWKHKFSDIHIHTNFFFSGSHEHSRTLLFWKLFQDFTHLVDIWLQA